MDSLEKLTQDGWEIVRESYIFDISPTKKDLSISLEILYDKNIAKFSVHATYLFDHKHIMPSYCVYSSDLDDDRITDDGVHSFNFPTEVEDEDGFICSVRRIDVNFDVVGIEFGVDGGVYKPYFGWLTKEIPIERARAFVERMPKGWLRYHSAVLRKGKKETHIQVFP